MDVCHYPADRGHHVGVSHLPGEPVEGTGHDEPGAKRGPAIQGHLEFHRHAFRAWILFR